MLSGVFCLFAAVGFVTLLIQPVRQTFRSTFVTVLISGGCAVGYAWMATIRKYWAIVILFVVEGILFRIEGTTYHPTSLLDDKAGLQKQLAVLGVLAIVTTCLGYFLFVAFTRREGTRYFRIETEMELAREIHRSLVPRFERKTGRFEVFGASIASGAVGGDLVDMTDCPGGWISYIADISGHGVSSGVLMAMFKTSIRSGLTSGGSPGELLESVHHALYPLKMPNMFVTAGVLRFSDNDRVDFSLAGHPPLMRYSRERHAIMEYEPQNLPVGILPEQQFKVDSLQCDPGDLLLLMTDGFSEVFDGDGSELGLNPLKDAFRKAIDCPLPEIFDRLRNLSLSFGKQSDDQTMLLLRYVEQKMAGSKEPA